MSNGLVGSMDAGDFFIRNASTKKTNLYINYANKFSIEEKSSAEYAKAKGKNAISFAKPSTMTLKLDVEIWDLNLLAFMQSTTVKTGDESFGQRKVFDITTDDQEIDLTGATPIGDKVEVYVLAKDGVTTVKELSTVTYDSSTKKVTCTGAKTNDKVVVYYLESKSSDYIEIKATPDEETFYEIEGTIRQKTKADGTTKLLNLLAKKVSISPEMSISFDTEKPSGFSISIDVLEDEGGDLAKFRQFAEA